jgi:hypothetical protein
MLQHERDDSMEESLFIVIPLLQIVALPFLVSGCFAPFLAHPD